MRSLKIATIQKPCERCGGAHWERERSRGFIQQHILSLVHRYPWRCRSCGNTRNLGLRHDPRPLRLR